MTAPTWAATRRVEVNLNAVSIGKNPPHDVNAVIEVPIGGEPMKHEMDKESGSLQIDGFLYT